MPRTAEYQQMLEEYRKSAQENRARWDERIRQYRMGHGAVRLLDETGEPLRCAAVRIRQKNHAFRFGCNCLMLDQLGTPERNETYERRFAELFNLATTTFCLYVMQPQPGVFRFAEDSEFVYRRPPSDRPVRFANKYGLALKGQPLLADSWHPDWAPKDAEGVKRVYREYFAKVAQRYGNSPYELWDVVNEAFSCPRRTPDFPLLDDEFTMIDWAFREARNIFPAHQRLELNEGTLQNCGEEAQRYLNLVKRLMRDEVPVESVGLQMHIFDSAGHLQHHHLPFADMENTYMSYAELGMPIAITEVTVQSRLEDCPKELGEEIQAAILENLYRLWFSAPTMHSAIFWNFADGVAWGKEGDVLGCLLDADLKPKPAYHRLYQLIHREWNTSLTAATNDEGVVEWDGFFGDYEISLLKEEPLKRMNYTRIKGAWDVDPRIPTPSGCAALDGKQHVQECILTTQGGKTL